MGAPAGWFLPLALVATLAADQALKAAVLAGWPASPAVLGGPVRVGPARSSPTFIGRLRVPPVALAGLWLACLGAGAALASGAGPFHAPMAQVAMGAALGGAAGNVVDVLLRRGVVDYLELGRWPACNLADVAIVSGVAGALLAS